MAYQGTLAGHLVLCRHACQVFDDLSRPVYDASPLALELFDAFAAAARRVGLTDDIRDIGAVVARMMELTNPHLEEHCDPEDRREEPGCDGEEA